MTHETSKSDDSGNSGDIRDTRNVRMIDTPPLASPRLSVPLAALSIAGSDSGGGAGIQADLRTFAAHGLLGTTAITAVTAQNTLGVTRWEGVSPGLVTAQIEAVLSDLPVRAAKTGMLGNRDIVVAVVDALRPFPDLPLVVDPVMVSTSGHRLLEPEAEAALIALLLPRADVLTPNRLEAAVLSGLPITASDAAHAEAIARLAPRAWVIIKGGHRLETEAEADFARDKRATDLVRAPDGTITVLSADWVETMQTHGTGCSYSAAIAARLALGQEPALAIAGARTWLAGAITHALAVGAGHGPVDHLFALRLV